MKKNKKKLYFFIAWTLGRFISFIFTRKTKDKILLIRDIVYSAWLSKYFRFFGSDSIIHFPMNSIGEKYISIGEKCIIGNNSVLTAWDLHRTSHFRPEITIGNGVSIGEHCHITSINKIVIGNNVLTGKYITITDNSHGNSSLNDLFYPPAYRQLSSSGPVFIGDGVWIGDKVTILPNVSIGKNAIVGANSVVTKDVLENCVVAGIPAKTIKEMK